MDAEAQRRAACCELVLDVACTSGEVSLKLTGTSMLPAVWPGDVVTVQRCNLAELQPRQIVLFRREGGLVAHRVVSVAQDHVITQGDSLPSRDLPVSPLEIVGQVIGISRNGRSVPVGFSLWQRNAAFFLRRSDFCLRLLLRAANLPARLRAIVSPEGNSRFETTDLL